LGSIFLVLSICNSIWQPLRRTRHRQVFIQPISTFFSAGSLAVLQHMQAFNLRKCLSLKIKKQKDKYEKQISDFGEYA
jgi:hypothetical protein